MRSRIQEPPRMRGARLLFFFVSVCVVPCTATAQATDRWISDQFEVTLRTGKSSRQSIIRVLPSGAQVDLLEQDEESGYSRVRTSAGTEGWLLTRYLVSSPTARLQLPALETRLKNSEDARKQQTQQVRDLQRELNTLKGQLGREEGSSRALQQDLDRIRELSANSLELDEQNQRLKQRLIDSERIIDEYETENRELSTKSSREWFLVGAAVITFGILLGLIIPRLRLKKKSSWGDL